MSAEQNTQEPKQEVSGSPKGAPEDGGPAFPETRVHFPGMTLRDYFYAKALPIANSEMENLSAETAAKILGIDKAAYTWLEHYPQVLARRALQIADAMLKAWREA